MVQMFMQDLKKVSALWSVHFGEVLFKKIFVCLREVSVLEDVHFREVPLYMETRDNLTNTRNNMSKED